jgi:hypothetical protein
MPYLTVPVQQVSKKKAISSQERNQPKTSSIFHPAVELYADVRLSYREPPMKTVVMKLSSHIGAQEFVWDG